MRVLLNGVEGAAFVVDYGCYAVGMQGDTQIDRRFLAVYAAGMLDDVIEYFLARHSDTEAERFAYSAIFKPHVGFPQLIPRILDGGDDACVIDFCG